MEIEFQLLDVDYISLENRPVIRILGKTSDGKTVCAFYDGFYPYFYVLPKEGKEEDIIEDLKKNFLGDLKNIEKVKRYLPIGFSEEKVEMLKVTLKDPSRTATIREHLRKKDFVEDVFEADILFKYRFMADFSLFGMSWYKVYGSPTRTESVKVDAMIKMEKIEPVEKIENAPLKYMALDIEVVSEGIANPQEAPIAIISLSFFPAFNGKNTLVLIAKNNMRKIDQDVLTFKDEKEMLEKFLEIIDTFDPDIIVGYNINDFDMPYINERLRINKMRRSIGRCTEKQLVSRSLGENRYKNSVFGRVIVDPYWMIKDMAGRGFFTGLKRFSLEDVSQYLLGEGKIEFTHKDMPVAWNGNEEQMKKFIDYARRDSELVLRLLLEKQLLDKYIGISKVSGLLLQDSLDTGEAGKVENLLLREFDKDGFVLPCKPTDKEIARRKAERDVKGFKGAFVLEPEVGLHTNCVAYLDFACHPLGTKVVVKGIGEKDISEVKEGEFVLGKNGWHKVVKKWEYDYKGYLVNINGLRCTPNHKIPVLKENERQKFVRDVTAISLFKNKAKGKIIFLKEFRNIGKNEKLSISKAEDIIKKGEFYEAKNPEFSLEYYEGKVYDLTLNSEPYYFANGILTHNSMYPSIFISYNICPTTLLTEKREEIEAITTPFGTTFVPPNIRKGIVPRTLERLIKERNVVKAQMKAEKDPVKKRALDSYQEGLKRIANASYGYTGFLLGRIYVLSIANAITSCGRHYIQETKRLVETNTNYKVIYGDTDSVMIKTDTQDIEKAIEIGNNIANFLNEKFQGKLRIKVENVFKTLLILTKKRYAGWSFEKADSQFKDEIVMKGIETVRRDWCDLVSETQEEVLKILLKEQNPKRAFAYFKEVVQKLQSGQIPLEKLTIIKGISKRPEQYKGVQPHVELVKKMRKRGEVEIPAIGDRVGFVIVKGLQLVSERAEDPEYVKKHNLKIDSKYYIESQLLPPLERVFEAIGINRSELIGLGKQMLLGEAINNHKKTEEKQLSQTEGVICVKCNTTFRRVPLIGRCTACGGELEFYFGEDRAKILSF